MIQKVLPLRVFLGGLRAAEAGAIVPRGTCAVGFMSQGWEGRGGFRVLGLRVLGFEGLGLDIERMSSESKVKRIWTRVC